MAVGGSKRMYLMAGAPLTLSPLATIGREWMLAILSVFGGEFTNMEDRQKLVEPMLGLWAMVLTGRHGATKELHELFCGLSQEQQQLIFPPDFFGELPLLLSAALVDEGSSRDVFSDSPPAAASWKKDERKSASRRQRSSYFPERASKTQSFINVLSESSFAEDSKQNARVAFSDLRQFQKQASASNLALEAAGHADSAAAGSPAPIPE